MAWNIRLLQSFAAEFGVCESSMNLDNSVYVSIAASKSGLSS